MTIQSSSTGFNLPSVKLTRRGVPALEVGKLARKRHTLQRPPPGHTSDSSTCVLRALLRPSIPRIKATSPDFLSESIREDAASMNGVKRTDTSSRPSPSYTQTASDRSSKGNATTTMRRSTPMPESNSKEEGTSKSEHGTGLSPGRDFTSALATQPNGTSKAA